MIGLLARHQRRASAWQRLGASKTMGSRAWICLLACKGSCSEGGQGRQWCRGIACCKQPTAAGRMLEREAAGYDDADACIPRPPRYCKWSASQPAQSRAAATSTPRYPRDGKSPPCKQERRSGGCLPAVHVPLYCALASCSSWRLLGRYRRFAQLVGLCQRTYLCCMCVLM